MNTRETHRPVLRDPDVSSIRSPRTSIIGVHPEGAVNRHQRLFAALRAAFEVQFAPMSGERRDYAGIIEIGSDGVPPFADAHAHGVPVLALTDDASSSGPVEAVRIGDHWSLDRRIRGVELPGQMTACYLELDAQEEPLAFGEAGVAWSRARGSVSIQRVRAALPQLDADEVLRHTVDKHRFGRALAIVALVHFLREVAPSGWEPMPLRATFVFDDPNLRSLRYGHIDFQRLLAHADEHGYHAAMAMVPLDASGAHREAVKIFGSRPDRLSLAIHGNDHSRRELLRPSDFRSALAVGAQAVRRIERFEQVTALQVSRVMIPPHGLCSQTMTRALGALRYDALCAIHPCPWTEDPTSDRLLAGWTPAHFIDGCAVVPRFTLSESVTEIALRAFLDQPLILYGHHQDVSSGLDVLAEVAAQVNRLGTVRWCSLDEIVTTNHELRLRGDTAELRPWSNRLRTVLPQGCSRLTVQCPAVSQNSGLSGWSRVGIDAAAHPFESKQPNCEQYETDIRLHSRWETDARAVSEPPSRIWPRLRRRAAEARDRLAPLQASRL